MIHKPSHSVSIVSLMRLLCLLSMIVMPLVFFAEGITTYVNEHTIILGEILAALVLLILSDAQRKENKYLLLLSWWLIFFVLYRIPTLSYTDYSVVGQRYSATFSNYNKSILLIIAFCFLLWIIFRSLREKKHRIDFHVNFSNTIFRRTTLICWIALIFRLASLGSEGVISSISNIISTYLLNLMDCIFLYAIYVLSVWKELSKKNKFFALITILSYAIFQILSGNRSGIYSVVKMIFFVALALDYTRIRWRYLLYATLLIPVMIFSFSFATTIRKMNLQNSSFAEKIELIKTVSDNSDAVDIKIVLTPIFDRIGYLDYVCEIYSQRQKFKDFINIRTLFMSTVDNALSPGFDVFDCPKIANMITNSYSYGIGTISSKSSNNQLDYHSDILTGFGESTLLFGIPGCFIFFAVFAFIFRRLWADTDRFINEKGLFYRVILLLLFDNILTSFGMDWFVLEVISMYITYKLFIFFAYKNEKNYGKI